MSKPKLTPAEQIVWDKIIDLQRAYCDMLNKDGHGHPSEAREWNWGIHILQSQIEHRMLCNEYPNYFRSKSKQHD